MARNRSEIHKYPNHTKTSVLRIENILKRSQIGFSKCNSETTPRELVAVVLYVTVACCKSVMITLEEPIRESHTYWGTAFNGPINGISWINPTRKQRLRLSVMASNNRCYRKFLYSQMVCVMLSGLARLNPCHLTQYWVLFFCTVCIAKSWVAKVIFPSCDPRSLAVREGQQLQDIMIEQYLNSSFIWNMLPKKKSQSKNENVQFVSRGLCRTCAFPKMSPLYPAS